MTRVNDAASFVEDNAKAWSEIPELTKLADEPPESVNGPGATLAATETLRTILPAYLRLYSIRSMLDVGCGDWTWMQHVDLGPLDRYTGWDVDPGQIERNQEQFSRSGVFFEHQNLLTVEPGSFPKVDLIFARHVLIHFPNYYIAQVLEKLKASGAKYLMTSHWRNISANSETQPEGFKFRGYMERPVNLTLEPFNWPSPIDSIPERGQAESAILADDHELALFEIPVRSFQTRVHPAIPDDDSGFSVLGTVTDFKKRVDEIRGVSTAPDSGSARDDTKRVITTDMLRAARNQHRQAVQTAIDSEPSVQQMQLYLGMQAAALDSIFSYLIGDDG